MKYYSTQRPVMPGSYPKSQKILEIQNFDSRQYVESISRKAWGWIEYAQPLSEKEAANYELVPELRKEESIVKNLAQLKRTLINGAEFDIVAHVRQECVGQHRKVNVADSTGFYSIIPDEPNSRETLANNGKGSYLGWSKASFWKFEGGTCTLYDSDKNFTQEHIIISLKVV